MDTARYTSTVQGVQNLVGELIDTRKVLQRVHAKNDELEKVLAANKRLFRIMLESDAMTETEAAEIKDIIDEHKRRKYDDTVRERQQEDLLRFDLFCSRHGFAPGDLLFVEWPSDSPSTELCSVASRVSCCSVVIAGDAFHAQSFQNKPIAVVCTFALRLFGAPAICALDSAMLKGHVTKMTPENAILLISKATYMDNMYTCYQADSATAKRSRYTMPSFDDYTKKLMSDITNAVAAKGLIKPTGAKLRPKYAPCPKYVPCRKTQHLNSFQAAPESPSTEAAAAVVKLAVAAPHSAPLPHSAALPDSAPRGWNSALDWTNDSDSEDGPEDEVGA